MRAGRTAGLVLAGMLGACGGGADTPRRTTPTEPVAATASPSPTQTPPAGDPLSGGETTVFNATSDAFSQPARNLPLDLRTDFFVGDAFFRRNWVTAPSSTEGSDGLGPLFNARSCSSCHLRDGRGHPPLTPDDESVGLLFRLSIPGQAADGGPLDEPAYGGQFNPLAILGVPAEGRALVRYTEFPGAYVDGDPYSLRMPTYEFVDLAYGALDPDVQVSPRTAPFVFGLGLLEALDAATILERADPDDHDHDGISGRPNRVWDRRQQRTVLGRFGWKANQSSIEQQSAGAFLGDIGLTSSLFPEQPCTAAQTACLAKPNGGEPELDQGKLDSITFYGRYLAVPARRDVDDPEVRHGETLFAGIGCAACHVATLVTGMVADAPPLSAQRIHPYTDLLLHDMGAELADERPDYEADGREWRTPPLWGVGLIEVVSDHTLLLHDGRARGFAEAILWHGGEAEAAREAFRALDRDERAALIRFLESL